jgi:hypothetical protein
VIFTVGALPDPHRAPVVVPKAVYVPLLVHLLFRVSSCVVLLRVSPRVIFRGLNLTLLFGLHPCVFYILVCFGLRPHVMFKYFGWSHKTPYYAFLHLSTILKERDTV